VSKINVEGSEISIIAIDDKDYISLTDMVRNIENGLALIEKWLRNKNTSRTESLCFIGKTVGRKNQFYRYCCKSRKIRRNLRT